LEERAFSRNGFGKTGSPESDEFGKVNSRKEKNHSGNQF
jgi:hypothetical protein